MKKYISAYEMEEMDEGSIAANKGLIYSIMGMIISTFFILLALIAFVVCMILGIYLWAVLSVLFCLLFLAFIWSNVLIRRILNLCKEIQNQIQKMMRGLK